MRVLFIGGTGNISYECTVAALEAGFEVYTLNRGTRKGRTVAGAITLNADVRDTESAASVLSDFRFDSVVDFISFTPEQVAASLALFRGRASQYVFISSASVYRKPPVHHVITEATPLANPFWAYARAKIACERFLEAEGRDRGLAYTIVRPSHTYGRTWIPLAFGSSNFTIAARMLAGKEVIVHGDGQALWTLTHARDFAVGLLGLLCNPAALGEAVQITGEEALTWDSIHRTVAAALGVEARIVHMPSDFIASIDPEIGEHFLGDKAYSALFDCSKLKRLVPAFRTTVPFHEGVRDSVAWFMADPARREIDQKMDDTIEKLLFAWRAAKSAASGAIAPERRRV